MQMHPLPQQVGERARLGYKLPHQTTEMDEIMGLEGVGDLALHIILSKLEPKSTAVISCVSKKFRDSASDDSLWFKFCSDDLDLSVPVDPYGNPAPSFKATYELWQEAFGMYPWPLVKRVKRCWDRIKNWLTTNFPEAEATLQKGASEAEIKELESSLKVKLPLPTRILYRFHDGQELDHEDFSESVPGCSLGLIGGYSFYDHIVNVYVLPLRQVILQTKKINHRLGFSRRSKNIVVAAASTFSGKLFFLNCTNGQLYVGTRNLATDGKMMPCVPNALISSVHDFNGGQQQDAMLLWLEEHGHRLQDGIIRLQEEGTIRSINLFPEKLPLCSIAVTNGVQVRASAVFVPEFSDLEAESDKYLFCYSIRMCLLPKEGIIKGISFSSCQLNWRHWIIRANDVIVSDVNGEAVIGKVRASAVFVPEFSDLQAEYDKYLFCYSIRICLLPKGGIINGMSFSSCQLNWRHWIIRANDVIVSDVNGEAVIGKFPLLHPGQKEFVYESCTPIESSRGSIEGAFTFVPGSLAHPKGGPFQVEVARFPLQLPDYIF